MEWNDCRKVVVSLSGVNGLFIIATIVFGVLCWRRQVVWKKPGYNLVRLPFDPVNLGHRETSLLESRIDSLQKELNSERAMKDDALNRLSSIAAARVRDGNPNVVDLSDQNRPGKLGEQYSELYDNEWTDAYSAIEDMKRFSDHQIIDILLQILLKCFQMYKNESEQQLTDIRNELATIVSTIAQDTTTAVDDMLFRVKEERKLHAVKRKVGLHKINNMLRQADVVDESVTNLGQVRLFTQAVARLCWLMCVQDPPMALLVKPRGNPEECFRAYQTRGKQIAYVVWPTLLLHDGGSFVFKGIAEFTDS